MAEQDKPAVTPSSRESAATARTPYGTFPEVATHGPRDPRCFHGKPEDWRRNKVKRDFGGKLKPVTGDR